MNKDVLMYFEDVLMRDVQGLAMASTPSTEIPDEDYRRALNVQLEAIKADVSNIQHLLDN